MRRALAMALLLAIAPVAQARTYLASIVAVPLGPREYMAKFSIDTWGVEIIAACRFPPGWRLTLGKDASPDGVIAGEGSHGVTWLDRSHLRELDRLVLVRLTGPVQQRRIDDVGSYRPATFAGTAHLGTYGSDAARNVALSYANVRLTPAVRCPSGARP